jgi:hypothetical protein
MFRGAPLTVFVAALLSSCGLPQDPGFDVRVPDVTVVGGDDVPASQDDVPASRDTASAGDDGNVGHDAASRDGDGAVVDCATHADCASCTHVDGCGWCSSGGGHCVEATSCGPTGPSCAGQFIWFMGRCTVPVNCRSATSCDSCIQNEQCDWCNAGAGSCVTVNTMTGLACPSSPCAFADLALGTCF